MAASHCTPSITVLTASGLLCVCRHHISTQQVESAGRGAQVILGVTYAWNRRNMAVLCTYVVCDIRVPGHASSLDTHTQTPRKLPLVLQLPRQSVFRFSVASQGPVDPPAGTFPHHGLHAMQVTARP